MHRIPRRAVAPLALVAFLATLTAATAALCDDFGWNRVPAQIPVYPGTAAYVGPWGTPWQGYVVPAVPSYPAYPATGLWSDGDLEWRFGTAPDGGWRTDYQWRNSGPHVHAYTLR